MLTLANFNLFEFSTAILEKGLFCGIKSVAKFNLVKIIHLRHSSQATVNLFSVILNFL